MSVNHIASLPTARLVRVNDAPDWTVFEGEIECPLCGYNLRGLSEARCPECGGVFAWRDLLDPQRRHHAFLYEFHPEAGLRSFLRTLMAGVNTLRFWRSVHPVLPIHVRRLYRYLFVVFAFMFASFVFGQFAIVSWQAGRTWWWRGTQFSGNAYLPWTWTVNDLWIVLGYNSHLANVLVWFAATFGAMLVFQGSMRRRRIRWTHVFRCLVYSSDVFVWLTVVLLLLDAFEAAGFTDACVAVQYYACLVAALLASARLAVAYRVYLQFPNPIMTVVATQVIALLVIFNLYIIRVWF